MGDVLEEVRAWEQMGERAAGTINASRIVPFTVNLHAQAVS